MLKSLVYLALGGNLGDRTANMQAALDRLRAGGHLRPLRLSRVYETEPVGYADQPHFLNLVLEARTSFEPLALLDYLKAVEAELGREPAFRNAPRPVDLDIIFYDNLSYVEERLQIPHPRLRGRGFVLAPLAELCPAYRHPVIGLTVAQLLAEVDLAQAGVEPAGEKYTLQVPPPRYLFVTGRLAQDWLANYLVELGPRLGFLYQVVALEIDIAAFMTCRYVAERLKLTDAEVRQFDRALLPGQAKGDPGLVEAATGIRTLHGPADMAEFEPFLANLTATLSSAAGGQVQPFSYTEEQLRLIQARVSDPNIRIYTAQGRVYAFNDAVFGSALPDERSLRTLFRQFKIDNPAHAYYLGREFHKAAVCLKLGLPYSQDREINPLTG